MGRKRLAELAQRLMIQIDVRSKGGFGSPPMIASISGIAYLAARITDSGLPPTPDPGLQVPGFRPAENTR